MATFSTRRTRMRFASKTSRFILLLAFIAATSFRRNGDASGMFALAAKQTNHIEGDRVLIHRTQETCQDSDNWNKRDRNGDQHSLCEWAALKPKRLERRCNRVIKKRNPNGPGRIDVSVQDECGCTCKQYAEVEPPVDPNPLVSDNDQTKISCPDGGLYPESSIRGSSCPTPGQTCGYRYTAFGCTQAEYQCSPVVECYCNGGELGATWQCRVFTNPGPVHCDEPRPLTENYEAPPSNVGQPCDPEENTGSVEDSPPTDSDMVFT